MSHRGRGGAVVRKVPKKVSRIIWMALYRDQNDVHQMSLYIFIEVLLVWYDSKEIKRSIFNLELNFNQLKYFEVWDAFMCFRKSYLVCHFENCFLNWYNIYSRMSSLHLPLLCLYLKWKKYNLKFKILYDINE